MMTEHEKLVRAEGYEAGKSDAGAEWAEGSVALAGVCRDLSERLAWAEAEIERLRAAYDTQLRRPFPSESELQKRLLETKLANLRAAAEIGTRTLIGDTQALLDAIEASK